MTNVLFLWLLFIDAGLVLLAQIGKANVQYERLQFSCFYL